MGSWMSEMEQDRVKRTGAGQNFSSFCSFGYYGTFLMAPFFVFPLMNGSHVTAVCPQKC